MPYYCPIIELTATAYSPSHITGFFEIIEGNNALTTGSRGAGVCLEAGVKTTVSVTNSNKRISVTINGEKKDALVSRYVSKKMLSLAERKSGVVIEHQVSVPIGAGFGSSGAGALSTALAINEALDLGLDSIEAAQVAHEAEIVCKTGLGTVLAEYNGGAVIRTEAGAPGTGSVSHFDTKEMPQVGTLVLGKVPTKKMLSDPTIRSNINKAGRALLVEFIRQPTAKNFMESSRNFAFRLNVFPSILYDIIEEGEERGFVCSIGMFGHTIFSLVDDKTSAQLRNLYEKFALATSTIFFTNVSEGGARLC